MEMQAKFWVERKDFDKFLRSKIGELIDISKIPEHAIMDVEGNTVKGRALNSLIKFSWEE